MSTNDYIKYVTESVVKYFDTPKVARKAAKVAKKNTKQAFLVNWFGMIPMSFQLITKRKKKRLR